jgi:hypothetical protein
LTQCGSEDLLVVHFRTRGMATSDQMEGDYLKKVEEGFPTKSLHVIVALPDEQELFQRWVAPAGALGMAVLVGGDLRLGVRPGPAEWEEAASLLRACEHARASGSFGRGSVEAISQSRRARDWLDRGCSQEAQQIWRTLLSGDHPKEVHASAQFGLARIALGEGDLTVAEGHLSAASSSEPAAPEARLLLAVLRFQQRRVQEARDLLESLSISGEDSAARVYYLSLSQHETGDDLLALEGLKGLASGNAGSPCRREARVQIAHISAGDHGHSH